MTEQEIIQILKDSEVLLEGHFKLTSGRHSDKYMQCARVCKDSKVCEPLCKELAEHFKDDKIDLVVGPATGAIIIAYETSRHLGVPNLFTERENGEVRLRRGFSVEKGQRILVVDDVVTTGGSIFEVIACVEAQGGVVVGVGSLVDRSNGQVQFSVPHRSVYATEVISYDEDECPLCKQGLPIEKPGSKANVPV